MESLVSNQESSRTIIAGDGVDNRILAARRQLYGSDRFKERLANGKKENNVFVVDAPGGEWKSTATSTYEQANKYDLGTISDMHREAKKVCETQQQTSFDLGNKNAAEPLTSLTQQDYVEKKIDPKQLQLSQAAKLSRHVRSNVIDMPALAADGENIDNVTSMYTLDYVKSSEGVDSSINRAKNAKLHAKNTRYLKATHFILGSDDAKSTSVTANDFHGQSMDQLSVLSDVGLGLRRSNVFRKDELLSGPMQSLSTTKQDYQNHSSEDLKNSRGQMPEKAVKDLRSSHFTLGNTDRRFYDTNHKSDFIKHKVYTSAKQLLVPPISFKKSTVLQNDDSLSTEISTSRHDYVDVSGRRYEFNEPADAMRIASEFHTASFSMGDPAKHIEDRQLSLTANDYSRGEVGQSVTSNPLKNRSCFPLFNDTEQELCSEVQSSYLPPNTSTKPERKDVSSHKNSTHFILGSENSAMLSEVRENFCSHSEEVLKETMPRAHIIATKRKGSSHLFLDSDQAALKGTMESVQQTDYKYRLPGTGAGAQVFPDRPPPLPSHYFHVDETANFASNYSTTKSDFIMPEKMLLRHGSSD